MKRLAGTMNPRSWNETKLTTYPAGWVNSSSSPGASHSWGAPKERGQSNPFHQALQVLVCHEGEGPWVTEGKDVELLSHGKGER
jgi:hypothetical protein